MRRYFVGVEKVKAPSNVTRLRTTIVIHRVYYDSINDRHDWAIVEVGEEVLGHLGLGGDEFLLSFGKSIFDKGNGTGGSRLVG
jgi:hypothetical protein